MRIISIVRIYYTTYTICIIRIVCIISIIRIVCIVNYISTEYIINIVSIIFMLCITYTIGTNLINCIEHKINLM
jgi:hypothetical protein